jgi:type IV secretion system protein TrbE
MFLREFRHALQGLPDLLNYAALVDEGVVLLKDGGFTAGWSFRGEDLESATAEELGAMASRINGCLTRLGTGWMMHVYAARRAAIGYPKEGSFPDRTTRTLEEARREHYMREGAHYVTTYVLLLTWWPPTDPETRAAALFVEGAAEAKSARRHLEQFQSHCRQLEDALSGVLRMYRMQDLAFYGGRRSEILQYFDLYG